VTDVPYLLRLVADKSHKKSVEFDIKASPGGKDEATPTAVKVESRAKVERPSVEDILRYPIEVFVSTGEAFVPPDSTYTTLNTMSQTFTV